MPLRPATTADIEGMHAVRMAVQENRLTDPARVTASDYRRMIEQRGAAWVYENDGEILGFGVVDLTKRNIWALFVTPGSERKGIGSALLQKLIDCAFVASLEPLWLTTSPGTRAENFYLKAGWRQAGATEGGELRFELPSRSAPQAHPAP